MEKENRRTTYATDERRSRAREQCGCRVAPRARRTHASEEVHPRRLIRWSRSVWTRSPGGSAAMDWRRRACAIFHATDFGPANEMTVSAS